MGGHALLQVRAGSRADDQHPLSLTGLQAGSQSWRSRVGSGGLRAAPSAGVLARRETLACIWSVASVRWLQWRLSRARIGVAGRFLQGHSARCGHLMIEVRG